MNLKIEKKLPHPPSVAEPYLLAYLPSFRALILYPPPPQLEKQEEPSKKKFAFKASNSSAPSVEQVYIYELDSNAWHTQQTKGKFPTRRENAASVCMGPCLMLFGGKQISPAKAVNDLYCLNLSTWQWKKLFAMQSPPVCPSPLAFAINDDSLIVIGKQIWMFNAKGVNWELEKGDLPGGLWEKIITADIPFQIKCGSRNHNQITVFGWEGGLKAINYNIESKEMQNLSIQGQFKGNGDNLQLSVCSEGKGLVSDRVNFGSFFVEDRTLYLSDWAISEQAVDRIVGIEEDQSNQSRVNYCISMKKDLVKIVCELQKRYQQADSQQLPDTTRQAQNPHHSSIIERENRESHSSPVQSPSSLRQPSQPIISHLAPLLSRQWLKRRILEEKGRLLQQSIKRAEKMVLVLCRYGGEEQKQNHIGKVRRIRQNLYTILNRQTYFRRQMEDRPGQNELREQVIRQESEQNHYLPQFQ